MSNQTDLISKLYPIPWITVRVDANSVIITRGHLYLKVARELGNEKIHAVVDRNDSDDIFIQKLLDRPCVIKLDWKTLIQEDEQLLSYGWLVFFFKRLLNSVEKKIFEEEVVGFFQQIQVPGSVNLGRERIKNLNYPYSGLCAEFQAYLPWEDERWYLTSRAVLLNFHLNCVPIVSFQGKKWQVFV